MLTKLTKNYSQKICQHIKTILWDQQNFSASSSILALWELYCNYPHYQFSKNEIKLLAICENYLYLFEINIKHDL